MRAGSNHEQFVSAPVAGREPQSVPARPVHSAAGTPVFDEGLSSPEVPEWLRSGGNQHGPSAMLAALREDSCGPEAHKESPRSNCRNGCSTTLAHSLTNDLNRARV